MTEVNFKPRKNYVLLEVPEISPKTKQGIIKTEEQIAGEVYDVDGKIYTVIEVGRMVEDLKAGDIVLLDKASLGLTQQQIVAEMKNMVVGFTEHPNKFFLLIQEFHIAGMAKDAKKAKQGEGFITKKGYNNKSFSTTAGNPRP